MADDPKGKETKPSEFEAGPDAQFVRDLAKLLTETGLSEIEIERQGLRLRVARNLSMAGYVPAPIPVPTASPAAAPAAAAGVPAATDFASHPGAVKSPMVGTVYVAPEPGAAPFVKLGDRVSKGQTLLLVEAMKTMNPIPAPKDGKVIEILVENEAPVEFGQTLVVIE